MSGYFSAGDWQVKTGHKEQGFIKAWTRSVDMSPPIKGLLEKPRLLKDLNKPGHFLSFAKWESQEAVQAFRSRPDFKPTMEAIREHADFAIYTLEESAS